MHEIIFKFCLGIVILLFSTQRLVGLAEKVSRAFRLSSLIVGITIVAIGTSLPELAVSFISILKHDAGLAMGNIIGSNIVNVLLIFPIGLLIGKLQVGTTKTQHNILLLIGATIMFYLTQVIGNIKYVTGCLLMGLAVLISGIEYKLAVIGRTHEDSKQFESSINEKLSLSTIFLGFFLVLGIILGGILVVDTVEKISLLTGISTTILGFTLTAIATSLPELMTTIFSQENQQEKITLGNILGSNIYNLLLIGGIIMFFPYSATIRIKEWLWLAVTTIVFAFILRYYRGQKPSRIVGVILLVFFLIYLFFQ